MFKWPTGVWNYPAPSPYHPRDKPKHRFVDEQHIRRKTQKQQNGEKRNSAALRSSMCWAWTFIKKLKVPVFLFCAQAITNSLNEKVQYSTCEIIPRLQTLLYYYYFHRENTMPLNSSMLYIIKPDSCAMFSLYYLMVFFWCCILCGN